MARIESFNKQQKVARKNLDILKSAWLQFISFDKFTKGAVVSLALVITITPMLVNIFLNFGQEAAAPIQTSPAIYFGVHSPGAPDDMRSITQFEKDAGKKVSIIAFDENWGDKFNLFYPATMDNVRSHGAIPMFTWNPGAGDNNTTVITLNQIFNGSYDAYISKFALEAKAWGHPFFLRFAPDMNDNSFSWAENRNTTTSLYVHAWQHVHDIFVQNNVTNVTWVWSPAIACKNGCSTNYSELYPGDTYVDWIGLDYLNRNNQSFSSSLSEPYTNLLQLAPTKPMMLADLSTTESGENIATKGVWITDIFATQLPNNFPNIKAVVWFNYDTSNITGGNDWRIESSQTAQQAFVKSVSSSYYMNNVYGDIVQSPIPPVGQYSHPSDMPSIQPSVFPSISSTK